MPISHPITRLPSENKHGAPIHIPIQIKPMSQELILLWKEYVQPIINKNYTNKKNANEQTRIRADVEWNWSLYYTMARIWNYFSKTGLNPRSTEGIALCLVTKVGTGVDAIDFPIGMLTAVPGFFSDALNEQKSRGFVWYLADAPTELYTDFFKHSRIRDVAKALIDTSIQASLDIGHDGSLLLHADPQGGRRLYDFYLNKCKMTPLAPNAKNISLLRRGKTEEYFHFDADQSKNYCSQFKFVR